MTWHPTSKPAWVKRFLTKLNNSTYSNIRIVHVCMYVATALEHIFWVVTRVPLKTKAHIFSFSWASSIYKCFHFNCNDFLIAKLTLFSHTLKGHTDIDCNMWHSMTNWCIRKLYTPIILSCRLRINIHTEIEVFQYQNRIGEYSFVEPIGRLQLVVGMIVLLLKFFQISGPAKLCFALQLLDFLFKPFQCCKGLFGMGLCTGTFHLPCAPLLSLTRWFLLICAVAFAAVATGHRSTGSLRDSIMTWNVIQI